MERSVVEEVRFERYEDFRRWVADRPGYWVLVRGVPMPSPSPSRKHQAVSLRFQLLLVDAVLRPGRGEVYDAPLDVKLREDTSTSRTCWWSFGNTPTACGRPTWKGLQI